MRLALLIILTLLLYSASRTSYLCIWSSWGMVRSESWRRGNRLFICGSAPRGKRPCPLERWRYAITYLHRHGILMCAPIFLGGGCRLFCDGVACQLVLLLCEQCTVEFWSFPCFCKRRSYHVGCLTSFSLTGSLSILVKCCSTSHSQQSDLSLTGAKLFMFICFDHVM